MQLKGRTAIVTGAAQGIGEAVARAFAREGARVCLADIAVEQVTAVAAALSSAGAQAIGIGCDVSRRQDVDAMVAATRQRLGPVDILVNNAGMIDAIVGTPGPELLDAHQLVVREAGPGSACETFSAAANTSTAPA